jgi:LacI family transcriptional regulator
LNQSKTEGTATLREVAAHAGVSVAAAAKVLNNTRANIRVSEATRQRIVAAAQATGYPYAITHARRQGRTHALGFYPRHDIYATHPFAGQLIGGLQQGCFAARYDLLLHGNFRNDSAEAIYDDLCSGKTDGLLLWMRADDPLSQRLSAAALPCVALVDPLPGIPSVLVDDVQGGRLQAEHLIQRGHTRVAYLTNSRGLLSSARRLQGFLEAAEGQLEVTVVPMRWWTNFPIDNEDTVFKEKEITAVATWNDDLALAVLRWTEQENIRVPEDLAVLGFNGENTAQTGRVGLSTIAAPWADVGKEAAQLLAKRLTGETLPAETLLPVALAPGRTT